MNRGMNRLPRGLLLRTTSSTIIMRRSYLVCCLSAATLPVWHSRSSAAKEWSSSMPQSSPYFQQSQQRFYAGGGGGRDDKVGAAVVDESGDYDLCSSGNNERTPLQEVHAPSLFRMVRASGTKKTRRAALLELCTNYGQLDTAERFGILQQMNHFLNQRNFRKVMRIRDMTDNPFRKAPLPQLKQFLVDSRTDIFYFIQNKHYFGGYELKSFQKLDRLIQGALKEAGTEYLILERVDKDTTPLEVLELLVANTTVHPVSTVKELVEQRLGPTKRIYVLSDPHLTLPNSGSATPLIVLYISLQPTIPASVNEIFREKPSEEALTVAAFYSIANLVPAVAGLGLGEHCIIQTMKEIQQSSENEQFADYTTLSPLPGFRLWLTDTVAALQRGSEVDLPDDLGNREDMEYLCNLWECTPSQVLSTLVETLDNQDGGLEAHCDDDESCSDTSSLATAATVLKRTLVRLVALYLTCSNSRDKPLDSVARFHCSNGAEVYRINYAADPSATAWRESFGIMVNYRYQWDQLEKNKEFLKENRSVVACQENWPL